ncbi:MAG: murein biosynthesis integral membrane protein MurJ [Anaerolineales bacterium]|nr:murein biosynthesis integral membrane protein MurJ [Anaerolineales bacterium]
METPGIPQEPVAESVGEIARGASWIALGNVASRVLGYVREAVKAGLFGTGAHVDALQLALTVPTQVYDLVTGGLVNSALVPVFSDYAAEGRDRRELWRLAGAVLTLAAAGVSLLVALLILAAPSLVAILGREHNAVAQAQAADLLRLMLPAVVLMSLAGVLTSLLYALKRFSLPAFSTTVFNAGIVLATVLLAGRLSVTSMAVGLLLGATLQVALQLPGLRDGFSALRFGLDLTHPGVRRVLRMYAPIVVSTIISQLAIYFALGVAWEFTGAIGWMNYATTLYQLPLGLVGVAVSSAVLPTLARQASSGQDVRPTLVQGLNLVLALIVPATIALFVLAMPVVGTAFERGQFKAADTQVTAAMLQVFLAGLSFAAVDLLLINAFYAQQNTWVPSLIGVLTVVIYITAALIFREPFGFFSLMIADALKQIAHACITGWLLSRRIGGFRGSGLWPTLARILLAGIVMAVTMQAALSALTLLALPDGLFGHLIHLLVPGALGALVYLWLARRLGVAEVALLEAQLRARLRARLRA